MYNPLFRFAAMREKYRIFSRAFSFAVSFCSTNARLTARCAALARRTNSNALHPSRTFASGTVQDNSSLDGARATILKTALEQVHQHGWTEEAISASVVSSNLPLSMIGMVTPSDIIAHFMDDCQERLQHDLDTMYTEKWNDETTPLSDRLVTSLRLRLQYVVPFAKSNRWHEGMALGATTNTTMTATQLDRMVQSIADAIVVGTDHAPLGVMERAAIGVLYVSTELHLLADDSEAYEATWNFLKSRAGEMQVLAQSANLHGMVSGDTAVAASAVVNSLGGAVVSLLQPAARGAISAVAATVIPHLATFLQPPQPVQDGTRASDYNVERPKNEATVAANS
jgi:rpsU-divergently transcribed protein